MNTSALDHNHRKNNLLLYFALRLSLTSGSIPKVTQAAWDNPKRIFWIGNERQRDLNRIDTRHIDIMKTGKLSKRWYNRSLPYSIDTLRCVIHHCHKLIVSLAYLKFNWSNWNMLLVILTFLGNFLKGVGDFSKSRLIQQNGDIFWFGVYIWKVLKPARKNWLSLCVGIRVWCLALDVKYRTCN